MITVKNLIKSYGKETVLKGIDFTVSEGEIFALLGPNGAGKTTTLECMEGLRRFEEGKIEIFGETPKKAMEQGIIGIQLQSSSLPANITVTDAMKLFCSWNQINNRGDLLERLGVKDLGGKAYKTLSTGQKRKLHLALALTHEPKVLFLDEPTAGLDVEARAHLHQEIKTLKEQGTTIILASHDMAEVESLCDRVGMIVEGKMRSIGSPREIVAEVEKEQWIEVQWQGELPELDFKYMTDHQMIRGVHRFKTEQRLAGLREILDFTEDSGLDLLDIRLEKPSLEERFIEISQGGKLS